MESALTTKGQATIPKAIREHLKLEPGDRIKFFKHPDGTVVILPKLPTSRLKGIVAGRRRRPASIEEMENAVAAGAVERSRVSARRSTPASKLAGDPE
jgi:AbrB family looped-hinge helix DNA binding protein